MSIAEKRELVINQIKKVRNPVVLDEVSHFIASKEAQHEQKKATGFTFDWAGGLKELKEDFTAVELQHYINSIRKFGTA